MKAITVVSAIGAVVMAAALVYGFAAGGGWGEVRELMAYPWFVVSLVDVYAGFALFACWIGLRESVPKACAWIVALFILGNLVACVYALIAARQAANGTRPLLS